MDKKKNIYLLSIVSLLNDFSSELILPILPFFIESLGGGGFVIGFIGGIRDLVSNVLKIFSGYIGDKYGKNKPLVFLGYFISSIFKFFLSLSKIWEEVLIFTSLERVGKGIRTSPRDSIISKSTKSKGKGFGIHRTFDTLGAILGSVGALVLFWKFKFSFKNIILIASIVSFFSLIPIFFVEEVGEKGVKRRGIFSEIKNLNRDFRIYLLIGAIFNISNFSYMFFMIYSERYFSGFEKFTLPILLYIFFNVFYAIFSTPFGKLSDKIGRKKVLISGYFLYVVTLITFLIFNTFFLFLISFMLYGITYAIVDGNQRAFVADLTGDEIRGTAYGVFHGITGFSLMLGNLLAGILWNFNPHYLFFMGIFFAFVSLLLFSFSKFQMVKN